MESTMSTTTQPEATTSQTGTVEFKLEVVILPVADADRAKQFYTQLGWREDADFPISEGHRVLQFTPPGSLASVIFGTGVTKTAPGSGETLLAVYDVDAARADLIARGVEVSEVFHGLAFSDTDETRAPGPDPEGASYKSFATFSDPDGNVFLLQELKTRLPGR
jgi:catechol 2,3-dioxygenase-like lactoylglutathione lyase family enzyme